MRAWLLLVTLSGGAALAYETVWMRRTALVLGGSALASAVTVGAYMAGMALGALLATRLKGRVGRWWAAAELSVAAWALGSPWLYEAAWGATTGSIEARWIAAVCLVGLPAIPLGATWPLLARTRTGEEASALYAANTTGAVLGVLLTAFGALPLLGLRATERLAVLASVLVAAAAWDLSGEVLASPAARRLPWRWLGAAALAGAVSLGLEIVWFRLSAVALGATVQTHSVVLATFLATVAVGAVIGRHGEAEAVVGWGLVALGGAALLGVLSWGLLPFAVARLYGVVGAEGLVPATALLAVLWMGGAPLASGAVFSGVVRAVGPLDGRAGALYAANTAGCIVGVWVGVWALPALEPRGAVIALSLPAVVAGATLLRRPMLVVAAAALVAVLPAWDGRLYAVGVHLRISEFADPSAAAVRRFADEGWELLSYDHGPTGAVAVGRSTRSGNVWLSIDGKVDASSGADMRTQELSGVLPVRMARGAERVLVVGLASGVTAGAVLAEPGVLELVVAELEPAVVTASHFFDHVNGRPLDDPRTRLVVDDARALLAHGTERFDVIISEPSNPWISGVSNLFTREYWELASSRLAPGGVMCQWVQLYGLPPDALRALVRTFSGVFPETWLFITIDGADALLIGGPASLPDDLPLQPRLNPAQVRRLGGVGWLNTDDHPRVEWEAPRWLHVPTGALNQARIDAAAGL